MCQGRNGMYASGFQLMLRAEGCVMPSWLCNVDMDGVVREVNSMVLMKCLKLLLYSTSG